VRRFRARLGYDAGMRQARLFAGALVALAVAGCGGGTDDGQRLTCGQEELRLEGTVDGATVSVVRATMGYAFANKLGDAPGTVDATTAQGQLAIEFSQLTADGGHSPARGAIVDSEVALDVGNCETEGFVSTLDLDADGNGAHFTLRQLKHAPYCTGAAATGQLSGCLGFKIFAAP
jgi:hypothetical protein